MPDVTDEEADILGYCVMLADLNYLVDTPWMPLLNVSDEVGLRPVDGVVLGEGVFNDEDLPQVPSSAVGFVFVEAGGEVSTSFSFVHVHFAASTGNPVNDGL